ncbi:MAG: hypothetical protein ACFFGP_04360, partial [Promethearchaeota archaeon]
KFFPDKVQNHALIKKVLPVSWNRCIKVYKSTIKRIKYKLVVLTGIYSGKKILIERFAWNFAFGLDNYHKFKFSFIRLMKPIRLKTIINVSEISSRVQKLDKISISSYPGIYLCNFLYYWALHLAKGIYPVIFLHIPAKANIETIKIRVYNIIIDILKQI